MKRTLLAGACLSALFVSLSSQDDPNEFRPDFANDGPFLTFHSDRDGDNEVYRIDLRTAVVTQLTHIAVDDADAAVSPDGTQIAFHSGGRQGERFGAASLDV